MNSHALRFALPSLLGVLLFLTPVPWDGHLTIGIGIVTSWVRALMGDYGLQLVVGLTMLTSVMTIFGTVFRAGWIRRHARLKDLFAVPLVWLLLRLAGMSFGLIYLFQFGPELLRSESVGGAVFVGIAVNVTAVYVSACLLLPLLTDFGLMEFVGTLARPLFQRVFRLPGRAAIDAVASVVGASAIGLLITIGQYDRGHYTARQACSIALNFSIVSIPFSLVVATVAGIEHYFIPWYGVVILTCLLAAWITPRLPPLSRKADCCKSSAPAPLEPEIRAGSLLREAWRAALQRAEQSPSLREFFATGISNLAFFLFSVITAATALATIAALVVFHTPVFSWLGYPFIFLFELARLPDATAAAGALFSGFLDQYMPAIAAQGIDSAKTSFVLAGLSVCQLIYMSEVGVIILRSSLPITLLDLVAIFLLRTGIALPVLIVGAHLVVR
ncbi:MAG: YjiH family protein [Gammaproteobacteria bacterium]|nr:YjiH family protein [Gammaproteobacteria bacterium]MDH5302862.1 YjiH family protein [Gammaproteobacteria bacterium]MDH5323019.1 YjiH family protein [Gammaproteobacteria bacterium]